MCILFIAVDQHKDYPLIIAANRDEFHERETDYGSWWPGSAPILAGKDKVAGGSWMGISKTGRLSALTNVRDPKQQQDDAISRGELVINFLSSNDSNSEYTDQLIATRDHYNGYNLLFGEWHSLQVYNNHSNQLQTLTKGVYGLSNAELNSPWPKTTKGMQALAEYCNSPGTLNTDHLFDILRDDVKADDEQLPKTGVPMHWEKLLSSAFIVTPEYGTRTSTLLLVDRNKNVTWIERHFDKTGTAIHHKEFRFQL